MSKETYTLEEAQVELLRRDCALNGHRWTVVEAHGVGPKAILCTNCGRSHPVGEMDIEVDPNFAKKRS